ncbi:MAG: 50S ribosomal protein L18 [Bacteroidota bacterium]
MAIKDRKALRRLTIKRRIRKVVKGTAQHPRLTVFRSNKEIYAQIIDDVNSKTLVAASSLNNETVPRNINKIGQAELVGKLISQKALELGITAVVFDRNGYLYHGRVKSLADAARVGGLKF